MKKSILALFSSFVAIHAYANQCPPASALSHPKAAHHWKLEKAYKDAGWYVANYPYSDTSRFSTLPTRSGDHLTVKFKSNEDQNLSQWFVTCEYDIWDSAFPRAVVVTNNQFLTFDPITQPAANFADAHPDYKYPDEYICSTSYSNLAGCSW